MSGATGRLVNPLQGLQPFNIAGTQASQQNPLGGITDLSKEIFGQRSLVGPGITGSQKAQNSERGSRIYQNIMDDQDVSEADRIAIIQELNQIEAQIAGGEGAVNFEPQFLKLEERAKGSSAVGQERRKRDSEMRANLLDRPGRTILTSR